MDIEVLICSFNKGIVKAENALMPQRDDVRYIVSFQYTDERYLEMIPQVFLQRNDVQLYKYKGQGLSSNRNQALGHAKADIVIYADDDTRLLPTTFDTLKTTFAEHPELDMALFRASSYTGRLLKDYPTTARDVKQVPTDYHISTIEAAFRREKFQGVIRYDERFGLGTKFLTCGEADIWLHDTLRHKLKVHYFPTTLVETSTMMKQNLLYVDAGVQRSYGAYLYYVGGYSVWYKIPHFALQSTWKGYCHFFPMLRHLLEGALYVRRTK